VETTHGRRRGGRTIGLPPVEVRGDPGDSLLVQEIQRTVTAALLSYPPGERPRDRSPIVILLAPDRERFRQWARGGSPEWAAGIVIERGRTILLDKSFLRDVVEAQHLLRHEIAHVMLDRRLEGNSVPRWFHEGFAQIHAGEWDMGRLWRLSRAAWTKSSIPLAQLRRSFPYSGPRARLAYAESQAAVQVLRKDAEAWRHLLELLSSGVPFDAAMRRSRGEDLRDFEAFFDGELMPGYRRWSLLFSTAPLFFLMMLLFLLAAWRRARRKRAAQAAPELPEGEWYSKGWIDRQWPG